MWLKLHSVFEAKSACSTMMLQQRFLQCKFEDGDLSVFLAKVQEMACQLKQAGEEVSEKNLITKVLLSLPDNYSHFISAWESVETSKQKYDDLVARLLVEEERLKARDKEKEGENMALYVKTTWRSGFVKKCFKCNKPGHFANECRSATDIRKCFSCGGVGHLKNECSKHNYSGLKNKHSGNLTA